MLVRQAWGQVSCQPECWTVSAAGPGSAEIPWTSRPLPTQRCQVHLMTW